MQTIAHWALVALMLAFTLPCRAQSPAGDAATLESRFIVDMPTAGVLDKLQHAFNTFVFPNGGIMVEWSIAPFHDLNVGISYGGSGIIGNGEVTWQDFPGLHARYRLFNETLGTPAITVGFSSQGRGAWKDDIRRFETQSPGLYAVASKSFLLLGRLDLHAGISYSFEPASGDRSVNPYFGVEKSIGRIISISVEYNATLFGNYSEALEHRGLLGATIRCAVGSGFTMELQARDLLSYLRNAENPTRTLAIEYSAAL